MCTGIKAATGISVGPPAGVPEILRGGKMLYYAVVFFIIALIAACSGSAASPPARPGLRRFCLWFS